MSSKQSKHNRLRLPRRLSSASDIGEDDPSKTPDDAERANEVGYGRPPKHTRFKKGQSGNPKGRAARSRNVKTIVTQVLDEVVSIREGGRERKVTRFEALVRIVVSRAFKGDQKAFSALATMIRDIGYGSEGAENISELLPDIDYEAILTEYWTRNASENLASASSSSSGQPGDSASGKKKGG